MHIQQPLLPYTYVSNNMTLEAVVFPQDLFGCTMKDLFAFGELGGWGHDFGHEWDPSFAATKNCGAAAAVVEEEKTATATGTATTVSTAAGRKKRRRSRSCKNEEEVENQRMTHIAVERNRRKLMNEYLAVLRSLMPPSYVQRGDQASIVGGAINFVKQLEQLLQYLDAQRWLKLMPHPVESSSSSSSPSPLADFFTFPQYSTYSQRTAAASTTNVANETTAKNHSVVADIEVTMVESHANLKVLSRRLPKQLLKMVVGLQSLRLTTLHLNVTTVDNMVLCSFSLKVEEDCHLTSVDDIATAVHHMVGMIQEESGLI